MPVFKINIAQDIRAYGFVKVDAKTIEEATAKVDHAYVAKNFDVHGHGADDYDHHNPTQIWLGDTWSDDEGNEGEIEIDLRDPTTRQEDRELGTILAALEYWKDEVDQGQRYQFDHATASGTYAALNENEIDELWKRLNR